MKRLLSNCCIVFTTIDETGDIDDLLQKLRQFVLPPSPLHQEQLDWCTRHWDVAVGQLLGAPVPGLACTRVAATWALPIPRHSVFVNVFDV
jgi:hypothetical protein